MDLTLVIGLVLVLSRKIVINNLATKRNVNHMFVISLIPIVLLADGVLSRVDGLLLLVVFLWYIRHLYYTQTKYSQKSNGVKKKDFIISMCYVVGGAILLVLSADYTVMYASEMAINAGLPLFFVGIMMLAFGTSLPELVFETKAVLRGHKEMALGDLYGSVVFNSTIVLAITALIEPIVVSAMASLMFGIVFLILALLLFMVFVKHGSMTWQEGIALIFVYIVFLIVQLELGVANGSSIAAAVIV